MRRRYWLGGGAILLVVGAGCFYAAFKSEPPQHHQEVDKDRPVAPSGGRKALSDSQKNALSNLQSVFAHLAPTAATPAELAKANIVGGRLTGTGVSYWFSLNVLPLLEADKTTNARHVNVGVIRDKDGSLQVSIWGRKARKKITVTPAKARISQEPHFEGEGLELDENPPGEKFSADPIHLNLARSWSDRKTPIIAIWPHRPSVQKKPIEIPFGDHGSRGSLGSYVSRTYPIAALPTYRDDPHEFTSVILVDVAKTRLVGEILFPPEARDTRPVFALDRTQNVLVATGYDLQWMLVIDLNDYVNNKASTPAPGNKPSAADKSATPTAGLAGMAAAAIVAFKKTLVVHIDPEPGQKEYHLAGCKELKPEYVVVPIMALRTHMKPCAICHPPSVPQSASVSWTEEDRKSVLRDDPAGFEEALAPEAARGRRWSTADWAAWLERNRQMAFRGTEDCLHKLVHLIHEFLPRDEAVRKLQSAGITPRRGDEEEEKLQSAVIGVAERLAESGRPAPSIGSLAKEVLAWRRAWAAQLTRDNHRKQQPTAFTRAELVKAIDFATILVKLDIAEVKVRLLGIVPPQEGERANDAGLKYLQELFVLRKVELEFDEDLGREAPDGMLQAWVWADSKLASQELVRLGYAKPVKESKTGLHWAAFYGDP